MSGVHHSDGPGGAPRIYLSGWVTNLTSFLLGVATGILTARALGPVARGELAVLMYFPGLMGTILPFALPYAASYLISGRKGGPAQVAAGALRLAVGSGVGGGLLCAFVAPFLLERQGGTPATQVALLCLLGPAFVINPVLYAVHRGFERFHWVNLMLVLAAAGNLTVLLALASVQRLTPFAYAAGCLGVQWVLVALNVWHMGRGVAGAPVEWATYAHLLRDGFRFLLPMSLIGLLLVADRAILIHAHAIEEMGYYVVAFSVAAPVSMVTEVFAQVGFVEIARSGDAEISSALAARRIRVAQLSSALAALLVLAITPTIVGVAFGQEYVAATGAAQILIVAVSLRGLSKVMEHFLRAKGLAGPGIVYGGVSLAWLVVLGLILAPVHGAAGLAVALLVAEGMGLVSLVVSFRKTFGVPVRRLWGIRPSVFREVVTAARSILGIGGA